MASRSSDSSILKELVDKRDLAIKWRKTCGWDDRLETSRNYYQYGVAQDLNDASGPKSKKKRQANYVFSLIEGIIPKMFDRMPSFQVKGRGEEDAGKAPKTEAILRYKIERAGLEYLLEDVVRDMLVSSLGVLKISWKLESKEKDKRKRGMVRKVYDKVTGKEEEESNVEVIEYDDLCYEVIQPEDFYLTAGDTRLDIAEGTFERMRISPAEAKRKYGKDLKPNHYIKGVEAGNDLEKEAGRVEIWVYSGKCGNEKKIWTFTDKEILDTADFPDHGEPKYAVLPNYRQSSEFYPWSEVYQIEPLQEELTEMDRQMSEYRKRSINPKRFVKAGAADDTNLKRLRDPRQNLVVLNDSVNDVREYVPAAIGGDIYNFRQLKKEDMSLITGINEQSRGGSEKVVKTAYGQQLLADAAESRIRHKVRAMERFIVTVLRQTQGLLAQFQDRTEKVKITDQDGFEDYSKEDIQGNFDYIIDIVETLPVLRERRGQMALNALELFKGDPNVDQLALKKKVMKMAFQDINAEGLIIEEPPVEPQPIPQEMMADTAQQPLPQLPTFGDL